jgi:hypothetical protein
MGKESQVCRAAGSKAASSSVGSVRGTPHGHSGK